MSHLKPDGTSFSLDSTEVIAFGENAVLLHHEGHALKIPLKRSTTGLSKEKSKEIEGWNKAAAYLLENEKAVYQRIWHLEGVGQRLNTSADGILLRYYKRGDLRNHIEKENEEDLEGKMLWILSLVLTVLSFHEAKILMGDIKLSNIVIGNGGTLRMIDFGKCSLLPQDVRIEGAEEDGVTVQVDMLRLGCVIYSIMAWKDFKCPFFKDGKRWRVHGNLPDVRGFELGDVIERCWAMKYPSTAGLWNEVDDRWWRLTGDEYARP